MNDTKLTLKDLQIIETNVEEAIYLVKQYAIHYSGKKHYDQLGPSCVMSAVNTVDTVIGSAEYLDGKFIMPDQIHVERLANWFITYKDYDCNRNTLTFFMANYIKRKINELYRSINRSEISTTLTILGHKEGLKEYKKQLQKRKGVKIIRQD